MVSTRSQRRAGEETAVSAPVRNSTTRGNSSRARTPATRSAPRARKTIQKNKANGKAKETASAPEHPRPKRRGITSEGTRTSETDEDASGAPLSVAGPSRSSRPRRLAASRSVKKAVAALVAELDDEVESFVDGSDMEDGVSKGSDVYLDGEDHESEKHEKASGGRRSKRKAENAATDVEASGSKSRAKKKAVAKQDRSKPRYRVPEIVERVWYEAGSVILQQLVKTLGNMTDAIRTGKMLLEMDLVAPDAFAEVFGGRADILRMRKPELVKLGMSAGIKRLSTLRLEQVRENCAALAYLSIENYKLWRKAEEDELRKSMRLNILPDQPLWLERLIQNDSSIFTSYRTTLKSKLRLPDDLVAELKYKVGYIHFRRYYGSWDQTVYRYRASVAIDAAKRWRAFCQAKDLDWDAIVSENDDLRSSLREEESLRRDILSRYDTLVKAWKKLGLDLEAVAQDGSLALPHYALTMEYLSCGSEKARLQAIEARKAVIKYNDPDEQRALKTKDMIQRFNKLSTELKKQKLKVPPELDPLAPGSHSVSTVRGELDICWKFVSLGVFPPADSTIQGLANAHSVWLELKSANVQTESAAAALKPKVDRFELLAAEWRARGWDGYEQLDPRKPKGKSPVVAKPEWVVSYGYIAGSVPLKDALDAQKAYQEYSNEHSLPIEVSNEQKALELLKRFERLHQIQRAWREHKLDDVDRLSVCLSTELRQKYPVTDRYILGEFSGRSKTLKSTVEARIEMRDKKLDCERKGSIDLASLPRKPKENHVYVCPCGYYSGRVKMELHLRINEDRPIEQHKLRANC